VLGSTISGLAAHIPPVRFSASGGTVFIFRKSLLVDPLAEVVIRLIRLPKVKSELMRGVPISGLSTSSSWTRLDEVREGYPQLDRNLSEVGKLI